MVPLPQRQSTTIVPVRRGQCAQRVAAFSRRWAWQNRPFCDGNMLQQAEKMVYSVGPAAQ
ncbi:hypothetical protein [Hymenobacter sp. B1770]|uniref:hypothetical protein n=1 Tax=Hymenobacter sp. B1770 TaxID=1718788 RepID=UPI003CE871D4